MSRNEQWLSDIPGATKAPMPNFVAPCLATLKDKIPTEGHWIHEIKFDGYRTQAHVQRGRCKLFTRRGFDWTSRFRRIAEAFEERKIGSAIFDGEIIVSDAQGRSDFHALQAEIAKGRSDRMTYCAFDLIYASGFDLRKCALQARRNVLVRLLGAGRGRIVVSEVFTASGAKLLKVACELGLEGIVSKVADSPYRSDRQPSWVKLKCANSDSFPIIAFVEKLGAAPRRVASLYLGRHEHGKLLYAGKAQTGFKTHDLFYLRELLDPYVAQSSPLGVPVKKPKATWVRPEVYVEVSYQSFTADGLLRSPVYKGVRDDLLAGSPASEFRSKASIRTTKQRSVPRENILQLLPEATSPTTAELRAYWRRIHQDALMYLARRPLKLVRQVGGTTFYHEGQLPPIPDGVRQLKINKREGGQGTRVWVEDLDGLLGLVDMDVVQIHPWNALITNIEEADTMVFDLDPGPGISWSFVIDAALTLREILTQEGFVRSWPKLTGGKGIHVMVPLSECIPHDLAHRRSKTLAARLIDVDAERFTISASLEARSVYSA